MQRLTWIRILALAVGLPVAAAFGWWSITPAGLPGSFAGAFILTGVIVFFIGLGRAGGMDTALDNIHPGSNIDQMGEQGLVAERRFLGPRRRWAGTLVMLAGAAYVAIGALFWNLR